MNFSIKKSDLSFKVYATSSRPTTSGTENDISIITSVPMSNWILSPDSPSGVPRTNGDVWIKYSVTGNTFNALKNNTMLITTISAWQYVDDVWVDVEAASYRNGVWTDWWNGELFTNGNQYENITGGWSSWKWRNQNLGNATISESGINVQPTDACVAVTTNDKVDLSKYSKVYFDVVENTFKTDGRVWFGAKTDKTASDLIDVKTDIGELSVGTYFLDVSGTNGEFYVGIFVWNATSATYLTYTINNVRLAVD